MLQEWANMQREDMEDVLKRDAEYIVCKEHKTMRTWG
jgi:hypothetical protein